MDNEKLEVIELKANEELFQKWIMLKSKIQYLSGIAQNDMTFTRRNMNEWFNVASDLSHELESLTNETIDHYGLEF